MMMEYVAIYLSFRDETFLSEIVYKIQEFNCGSNYCWYRPT